MLQGHIKVPTNFITVFNCINNICWEAAWEDIVQPYPLQSFHLIKFANKLRYISLAVQVETIIGKVLCNQHYLFHALLYQSFSLCYKCIHWYRNVIATHKRDSTERTFTVAPFRYFHVGIVVRCG